MTQEQKIKAIEKLISEYRKNMGEIKADFDRKVKVLLSEAHDNKIQEVRRKINAQGQ